MKIGLGTSEPSGDDNTCASIDVELRTLRLTLKVGVPNERYTVSVTAIPRGNASVPSSAQGRHGANVEGETGSLSKSSFLRAGEHTAPQKL